MFKNSFNAFLVGFSSVMIASVMFYFGLRSFLAYGLFALGFIIIGIGILLAFFKMVSDK